MTIGKSRCYLPMCFDYAYTDTLESSVHNLSIREIAVPM